MLSGLIALPLVCCLILFFIRKDFYIKLISCVFACLQFVISLYLYITYPGVGFGFEEFRPWLSGLKIHYYLGVDGMSLAMMTLSNLLILSSVIYSFSLKHRVKEFFILLFITSLSLIGVFSCLNLILFFVFWELVLIPMYFMILIWGHENRRYAAFKFILYTALGSGFMLIGFILLGTVPFKDQTPRIICFDIPSLYKEPMPKILENFIYFLIFLGFAIKVPLFPFHTWLPDAHVEAPTVGSVILAGILLKMGAYGFLRILHPLIPEVASLFAIYLAILGLINVIYGAFLAMAQKDLKRLVAYSSISHMGFVMLGIASMNEIGKGGAVLQMVSHGLITPALFLLVGMIYDRVHRRGLYDFGRLAEKLPIYSGFCIFCGLASLGLPGLSGFIAEFFCFLGSFLSYKLITIFAILGIVLTAWYVLHFIKEVFFGQVKNEYKNLYDLKPNEIISLILLCIPIFIIGIYPAVILAKL